MLKFTKHVQDSTIRLMIKDKSFLKICRAMVPYDIFPNEVLRTVTQGIYNYWDSYHDAPKLKNFKDFFYTVMRIKRDEEKLYKDYFKRLKNIKPNKKYITSKLSEFVQYRVFSDAILEGADLLKQGNLAEFKGMIYKALKTQLGTDELGSSFYSYKYKPREDEVVCKTMIEELDKKIGGYNRGELFVWIAPTGVGKSWAMIYGGKACLIYGIKSVYYTLEMTTDPVQQRQAMAVTGLRRDKRAEGQELIIDYFDGEVKNLSKRKSLETDSKTLRKNQKFLKRRGGDVITKQFIGGKATVAHIEAHLDQLEIQEGFVPDIIFVDHLRLLTAPGSFASKKDEIDDIAMGLHAIAKERNISVVTALHGNRASLGVRQVRLKHSAGSIDIANLADVVMTLNQTEEEKKKGIMRIFADKVREGADKWWEIEVKQSYEVGAFHMDSRVSESAVPNDEETGNAE